MKRNWWASSASSNPNSVMTRPARRRLASSRPWQATATCPANDDSLGCAGAARASETEFPNSKGDVMARIYNFSAGPAVLPEEVLSQARDEMLDWRGSGMSVMEMSHRGKEFMSIAEQAEADLRELLAIPSNYKVLFLQGGASSHLAMVPLNLQHGKKSADYVNTGMWSKKAIDEAKRGGAGGGAAGGGARGGAAGPARTEGKLSADAAYVHYTPNETIGGVEFHWIPETSDV